LSIETAVENQRVIERTLILHQIKIKNVEKWNGAKVKDFVQKSTDITVDGEQD
jgi:hypothetical protein